MRGRRWSRRKILIAVAASIGIVAMVATSLAALVMPFLGNLRGDAPPRSVVAQPTSTTPAPYIAPLVVRPVEQALVAVPDQCPPSPPPVPAPSAEPLVICDLDRRAEYHLGPEAMRLDLTGATSLKLPTNQFYSVSLAMDAGSGTLFGQYTGTQIGKQVAFVRDGVVLAAAAITQPLDGDSLQLSGDYTAQTAETIARMLREGR